MPLLRAIDSRGRVDRKMLDDLLAGSGVLAEAAAIVMGEGMEDGAAGWLLLSRGGGLAGAKLFPGGVRRYRTFPGLPLAPAGAE
ncbi:MAG: hypothetical protein Q9Q13_13565 [Acidobacteriota bacterium]|nr:hypothetical protein [Acidobacteriota bacterium]